MKQRRTSRARRITVLLVVLGAAGALVAIRPWANDGNDDIETDGAATPASSVAVTVGDLTATVSLDGSLTSAATTAVVHRIEGETASATPSAASLSATSATNGAPAALALVSPDCVTPAETTTTTGAPTPSSPPDSTTTTMPDPATSPDTTTTVALTTTIAAVPTTVPSAPPTTEACDDSTSTTIADPAAGSVPVGGFPSGGLPGGVATGSAGGGATSTGTGASTRATQIVTSVRPVGSMVGLGDVLYTVDGSPVVVLRGLVPAWRTLSTSSDDGFDIAQLEDSLTALGYDPDGDMTVDGEFDAATEAAVERWQEGLGVEATGEVTLGRVVFLATDETIASVAVTVGDEIGDGDVVAQLATASQQVVVDVPAEDQQLIAVGTPVELGDAAGTVTRLRSVETDSGVGVQAVITPGTPIEGGDGAVVKVRVTSVAATSVTLVPVDAVASRLDGTYAVQVVDAGSVRWVPVEIVGVAGRNVGVTGDGIVDGTQVLVPA